MTVIFWKLDEHQKNKQNLSTHYAQLIGNIMVVF